MLPFRLVVVLTWQCLWAQTPLYLGVLESGRAGLHVRVAFEFRQGRWTSMPQDDADSRNISWTVALDGKKLGELSTRGKDLVPGSRPPQLRQGAGEFENWMERPPFRPLVLISQPNFHDPDQWKPFRPPPGLLLAARSAFIQLKAPATCQGERVEILPERDLRLVQKAYRSAKGAILAALQFEAPKEAGDLGCETIWFFRKDGQFHYIGAGLTLLDAGDYDAGGSSEVIFFKSGYNQDGYVLLNTQDASTQSHLWSYH
jgi:hypothetical protein